MVSRLTRANLYGYIQFRFWVGMDPKSVIWIVSPDTNTTQTVNCLKLEDAIYALYDQNKSLKKQERFQGAVEHYSRKWNYILFQLLNSMMFWVYKGLLLGGAQHTGRHENRCYSRSNTLGKRTEKKCRRVVLQLLMFGSLIGVLEHSLAKSKVKEDLRQPGELGETCCQWPLMLGTGSTTI